MQHQEKADEKKLIVMNKLIEEVIDTDREFSSFADSRVIANMTFLLRTVRLCQIDPDVANKLNLGERESSLVTNSGTTRFVLTTMKNLWSAVNSDAAHTPRVSIVSFFHLRTLMFFSEVLPNDQPPAMTVR